jgi:hypothetical protein
MTLEEIIQQTTQGFNFQNNPTKIAITLPKEIKNFKLECITPLLRFEIDKVEVDIKNEKILLIHYETNNLENTER